MTKIKSKIGEPACYEQLAEECAELGHAALKVARILRNENPTPCDEAMTRKQVSEELGDALPSVTPKRKTGKWLDAVIPNDNGGLPVQVCDQCNTFFPLAYTGGGHRFCPNCGARMTEDV